MGGLEGRGEEGLEGKDLSLVLVVCTVVWFAVCLDAVFVADLKGCWAVWRMWKHTCGIFAELSLVLPELYS